jgi:hypothetical protein
MPRHALSAGTTPVLDRLAEGRNRIEPFILVTVRVQGTILAPRDHLLSGTGLTSSNASKLFGEPNFV